MKLIMSESDDEIVKLETEKIKPKRRDKNILMLIKKWKRTQNKISKIKSLNK
jgi:hypothetical protein